MNSEYDFRIIDPATDFVGYKPTSVEDYIKLPMMLNAMHEDKMQKFAEQQDLLNAIGQQLNPELDKDLYDAYKDIEASIRNSSDELARNGLNGAVTMQDLLNQRRTVNKFSSRIAPLLQRRLDEAAAQQKAIDENPDYDFSRLASNTGINWYFDNPVGGYKTVNTGDVYDLGKEIFSNYKNLLNEVDITRFKNSGEDDDKFMYRIYGMTDDDLNKFLISNNMDPARAAMIAEEIKGSKDFVLKNLIKQTGVEDWNEGKDYIDDKHVIDILNRVLSKANLTLPFTFGTTDIEQLRESGSSRSRESGSRTGYEWKVKNNTYTETGDTINVEKLESNKNVSKGQTELGIDDLNALYKNGGKYESNDMSQRKNNNVTPIDVSANNSTVGFVDIDNIISEGCGSNKEGSRIYTFLRSSESYYQLSEAANSVNYGYFQGKKQQLEELEKKHSEYIKKKKSNSLDYKDENGNTQTLDFFDYLGGGETNNPESRQIGIDIVKNALQYDCQKIELANRRKRVEDICKRMENNNAIAYYRQGYEYSYLKTIESRYYTSTIKSLEDLEGAIDYDLQLSNLLIDNKKYKEIIDECIDKAYGINSLDDDKKKYKKILNMAKKLKIVSKADNKSDYELSDIDDYIEAKVQNEIDRVNLINEVIEKRLSHGNREEGLKKWNEMEPEEKEMTLYKYSRLQMLRQLTLNGSTNMTASSEDYKPILDALYTFRNDKKEELTITDSNGEEVTDNGTINNIKSYFFNGNIKPNISLVSSKNPDEAGLKATLTFKDGSYSILFKSDGLKNISNEYNQVIESLIDFSDTDKSKTEKINNPSDYSLESYKERYTNKDGSVNYKKIKEDFEPIDGTNGNAYRRQIVFPNGMKTNIILYSFGNNISIYDLSEASVLEGELDNGNNAKSIRQMIFDYIGSRYNPNSNPTQRAVHN